jgi:hypothetical protein
MFHVPSSGTGAEAASAAVVATRPGLKRVLLLVDARHGLKVRVLCMLPLTLPRTTPFHQPLFDKAGDVAFLEDLFGRKDHDSGGRTGQNESGSEAATTPLVRVRWQLQVVLTKSDLVERSDLARRLALVDGHLRVALAATRRPPGLGQVRTCACLAMYTSLLLPTTHGGVVG